MAGLLRMAGRVLRGVLAAGVLSALVAGLPWALGHYIGWPLPNHVPSGAEVSGVLLGPMTTPFLVDVLACLCWIAWALFTLDVARCTVLAARRGWAVTRWRDFSAGPMHALAGVLVGAILLSVLGHRPAPAPSSVVSATLGARAPVAVSAPAWPHPTPSGEGGVHVAAFTTETTTVSGTATGPAPARPASVVVLAPHNGVHDSLWRIAARTLGDGARWPEIFQLNQGKPQPNGRPFTNPSRIFPGEELALPPQPPNPTGPAQSPVPPEPTPPDPTTTPPTSTPPPTTTAPSTTAPPSSSASPAPSAPSSRPAGSDTHAAAPPTREPGWLGGPELFVGLGLAAAISALLVIARRRSRARYRPGSGNREDLPVPPVVYQLCLAHLRADADDDPDDGPAAAMTPPREALSLPATRTVGAPDQSSDTPPARTPRLGVRDGREIALDLAAARGLGLLGAGAPAAARALLVAALTATDPAEPPQPGAVSVVIPSADLATVVGRAVTAPHDLPAALRVVADVDDALDLLEAETLARAAPNPTHPTSTAAGRSTLILITRAPQHHQRLQAVLDNGAPFGITGVLLGQWQPGVTAYIREDGTVSATNSGLGEHLRGTRMFRLGEQHTVQLLDLLRQAQPEPAIVASPQHPPHEPATTTASPPDSDRPVGLADIVRTPDTRLEVTAAAGRPTEHPTGESGVAPPSSAPPRSDPGPAAPGRDRRVTSTPAAEADPRRASVVITVLGPTRVCWRAEPDAEPLDVTAGLQPRARELLVFLALHPQGATREALIGALWPDTVTDRAANAMNTALSRLRSALAKAIGDTVGELVLVGDGRYRLDPDRVAVDYWRFEAAVRARRAAATEPARIAAYRAVLDSYRGALADGLVCEWIEPPREAIRRDAIDAVAALARALVDADPQQTLDLLETARAFDPHNELLYRDIMRLQQRLGQLDAIPRTLTLLTTRLAEIDERPSPHTVDLAARLHYRHDQPSREHGPSAAAS